MKNTTTKIFKTILLMLAVNFAQAQVTEAENSSPIIKAKSDTTKLRIGDLKVLIIDEDDNYDFDCYKNTDSLKPKKLKHLNHWAGFDMGINGYMVKNNSFELPTSMSYLELDYGRSFTFNLNPFEKNFKIIGNYFGIVTGLGFEFDKYHFENKYSLNAAGDSISASFTNIKYEKNILSATYLTAPLLLEFNTNRDNEKSMHMAIGVVGAYKIGSSLKQKYEFNSVNYKTKIKDDFHLNPFKYSVTARVGYGKFNVFANYGLSELFKGKSNPRLNPFSVGITLVGF